MLFLGCCWSLHCNYCFVFLLLHRCRLTRLLPFHTLRLFECKQINGSTEPLVRRMGARDACWANLEYIYVPTQVKSRYRILWRKQQCDGDMLPIWHCVRSKSAGVVRAKTWMLTTDEADGSHQVIVLPSINVCSRTRRNWHVCFRYHLRRHSRRVASSSST